MVCGKDKGFRNLYRGDGCGLLLFGPIGYQLVIPLMTNKRAESILQRAGFGCEPEPDWISEGRKPDFFCQGPNDIWVEVKTLGESQEFELQGDAHVELRRRAVGVREGGRAQAWVTGRLHQRDAKVVMQLAERALRRFREGGAAKRLIAMVPNDPVYDRFVRFSITTEDGEVVDFLSCASQSGVYDHPYGVHPSPYDQKTTIHSSEGAARKVWARDLITYDDSFRVALDIAPQSGSFEIAFTAPTGTAKKLNTVERIRDAVSDANAQFKNGCVFRGAPCLLIIFHDSIFVGEDVVMQSALYGDLKYIAPSDRWNEGELFLDTNVAWNANKNRTTSAVAYVRNDARPLVVHNLWARNPMPPRQLEAKEIIAKDDGTFEEIA